jgi:hypothetical protein
MQVLHAHWAALQLWVDATLHLAAATEPLRRALRGGDSSATAEQGVHARMIEECVGQLAKLEMSVPNGVAPCPGAACASSMGEGPAPTERSGSLSSNASGAAAGGPGRSPSPPLDCSGCGGGASSTRSGAGEGQPPAWVGALLAADVDDLIQRHKDPLAFAKFLGESAKDMAVNLLRWVCRLAGGWAGG